MQADHNAAIAADARKIGQRPLAPTSTRQRIEDAIEALIRLLDALDGDADCEDNGDSEPSLGWTKTGAWGDISGRDLEAVNV